MVAQIQRRSGLLVLLAILAAAFNLRIGIVAIGPVIEEIRADTQMSSALAGVLTTIPFLCVAAFTFLGPPLVRRHGAARVVIVALVLIALGSGVRSLAEAGWVVLAATVPIGLGIALIGVTLPAVVKVRFPHRGGAITGAYVASLSVGIALVGFGLVPLSSALGGWREGLLTTAIPALAAITLWLGMAREPPVTAVDEVPVQRRLRPSRPALLIGTVFGLQSLSFAAMVSWAPAIYEQAGWSQTEAALTTSSIGIYTLIAALLFPPLSDGRDRRLWVAVALAAMSIGVLGVALLTTTGAWIWLTLFGLGTGAGFSLLLAVPLDLADDPAEVTYLSAWLLCIGNLVAAFSPVFVGALRDATGDFALPMSILGAAAMVAAALALLIPRRPAGKTPPVHRGRAGRPSPPVP